LGPSMRAAAPRQIGLEPGRPARGGGARRKPGSTRLRDHDAW
jgi:hypothetical protein